MYVTSANKHLIIITFNNEQVVDKSWRFHVANTMEFSAITTVLHLIAHCGSTPSIAEAS